MKESSLNSHSNQKFITHKYDNYLLHFKNQAEESDNAITLDIAPCNTIRESNFTQKQ